MKPDVRNWLEQAEADMRAAGILLKAGEYHAVVFHVHQASEKALKALLLARTKNPNSEEMTSHSLSFLGRSAKVPEEMQRFLRELSPHYVASRYPLPGQEAPVRLYAQEQAARFLKQGDGVVSWIKKRLA